MSINLDVKFATNVAAFKASLIDGLDAIEVTRESIDRLAKSLSGETAIKGAARWASALDQIGGQYGALAGIEKLTTAEHERATKAVDKALEKYQALGKDAPQSLLNISDALHKATGSTTGWASAIQDLGQSWAASIASGILLRDAVHAVVGKMKEMVLVLPELALKGAAVADVEENFKRLNTQAGRLGETLLGELRAGTHNTITDFELMKTANQDLAAGMSLTDKQFGTLAKGAFALAQATGGDVKTGLDTMNDAMLTGRTRSLALLVGKLNLTKAEEDFAKGLLSTADHLTEEGKLEAARVAILKAVGAATERLGEQTDGLDERVAQASTAWENFKENLGKTIATSAVLETGMSTLKDQITETFGPRQDALIKAIAATVDDAAIAFVGFGKIGVAVAGGIATEFYALKKVIAFVAQAFDEVEFLAQKALKYQHELAVASGVGTADGLAKEAAAAKAAGAEMERLNQKMADRLAAFKADDDAQKGVSETTKKYTDLLNELQGRMSAAKNTAADFVGPLQASAKAQDAAATATGRQADMLQRSKNELSDAESAQKKYAAAVERYNSTEGADYLSILDKIGNAMYEGIAFDIKRGKSTKDIVEIYKTTETVIDQVVKSEKAHADAIVVINRVMAIESTGLNANAREWTTLGTAVKGSQTAFDSYSKNYARVQDDIKKSTMTTVDYQIAKIEEWRDETIAALDKTQDGWQINASQIKQAAELEIGMIGKVGNQLKSAFDVSMIDPNPLAKQWQTFGQSMQAGVSDMAGILQRAFEGGGHIEGAMKSGLVGLAQHMFGKGGVWEQNVSKQAAYSAAAIQAGLAVASSLASPGSRGSNIASLAGQGAAIGTSIVPGYGTAIGAGVGAAIGAFKVPDDEKAARQQLNDFKKQLADLFDTTASFQAKATVGSDDWAKMVETVKAAYLATGRTAEDALKDINTAADHTRNNVEALPEDLAKINKILQQTLNFGAQAQASASAVGLIDKSFLDLLNHAKQLGGLTQSMKDFVAAQGSNAETGIAAALDITNAAYSKRKDILEQIAALGTGGADQTKLAELNAQLQTQNQLIDAVAIHSQAAADAVSGSLLAIINNQILAGKSFHDSVVTVAPAVDALSAQMIAAGLNGSAAFDALRAQVALVKDEVAGPALTAVEGYAQGLVGLNNAGLLNQDMFAGLTSQIGMTRDALIAQGQDGIAVLSAMRGPLQTIWELQTKFGYTTDESTQALLDQAKEQGLVGEKFKPIGEQMLDATNRIVKAVETLATNLGGLVTQAQTTAAGMQNAFSNIHPPSINIPVNFVGGSGVSGPDGYDVQPENSFAAGSGGLRDFGSGQMAMLHGREAVLTASQFADATSGGSRGAVFEAMLAQFRTTQQTTDRLARYLIQDQATVLAKAMRDEVGKVRTHT